MIKTSLAALAAVAVIAVGAAPAFADTSSVFGDGDYNATQWTKDAIVSELQRDGVNATSVEQWGEYIRAYVTLEDGTQVMQFFEPGSLLQVNPNGAGGV